MGKRRQYTSILKDDKESYKHLYGKAVLAQWLSKRFETHIEVRFENNNWPFIVDVVTFIEGHIQGFYEVVHKHPIDYLKLARMQDYSMRNNLDILCHEVDAEWILIQIDEPDKLIEFVFDLSPKL